MKTTLLCFTALLAVTLASPIITDGEINVVGPSYESHSVQRSFNGDVEDIDDRIAGGEPTTIQQHPHLLSVRLYREHFCGGSILTATRGLTASHCLLVNLPEHYLIMAGSTLRAGDANAQYRVLLRYLHHPRYNMPYRSNDIAILFWTQPLTFGPTVRPIQLPQHNASVPYGQNATIAGFGTLIRGQKNEILRSIREPIVSPADCGRYPYVTDLIVCAGGDKTDVGTCSGDEGGPLMSNGKIIGVLSWLNGCGRSDHPSIYTRVPLYVNWLRENMQ